MDGPTYFLTLNARTGASRLTPLRVENEPPKPKPPKPPACACGHCGTKRTKPKALPVPRRAPAPPPPPMDPAAIAQYAQRLSGEALVALREGNHARARELGERADLAHGLLEAEEREAAREAGFRVGVWARRGVRPILAPTWAGSVLADE